MELVTIIISKAFRGPVPRDIVNIVMHLTFHVQPITTDRTAEVLIKGLALHVTHCFRVEKTGTEVVVVGHIVARA